MLNTRIPSNLEHKVMHAACAAQFVQAWDTIALSGFRVGDVKVVPLEIAKRMQQIGGRVNIISSASLGAKVDSAFTQADAITRRAPFQQDPAIRRSINTGNVSFTQPHLGELPRQLLNGHYGDINVAVIEAVAIMPNGTIVPSSSMGCSMEFVRLAEVVIVEVNEAQPLALADLHRDWIPCEPSKIVAIVITNEADAGLGSPPADAKSEAIAKHLIKLLVGEVKAGRMPRQLLPIEIGVGAVSNAVLSGLGKSELGPFTMYSEVIQDAALDLMDQGRITSGSACAIVMSPERMQHSNIADYKDKITLLPQRQSNGAAEITAHDVIAINSALEADIYGNVNSTHINGTHILNGIGGSGDFARHARLSVFVMESTTKAEAISRIVPMVPHVDHIAQDVDILVTEQGLADLRGLSPRECAYAIINNCIHPAYAHQAAEYFDDACRQVGGNTPHILGLAFSWHDRLQMTGSMQERLAA